FAVVVLCSAPRPAARARGVRGWLASAGSPAWVGGPVRCRAGVRVRRRRGRRWRWGRLRRRSPSRARLGSSGTRWRRRMAGHARRGGGVLWGGRGNGGGSPGGERGRRPREGDGLRRKGGGGFCVGG